MSMNYCTIYDKLTGEIVQNSSFTCAEDSEQIELNYLARLGFYGAETHGLLRIPADGEKQYVAFSGDELLLVDKPPIPFTIDKTVITAGTGDFLTITGLHIPCDVIVDDPDPLTETTYHTVTGGAFEFEAEVPGTYTLQIMRHPFLPATITISAIPESAASGSEFSQDFSGEFA